MPRPKHSLNRVRTLGQAVAAEHCPKAFKVALDVALGKCFHHPDGLDFSRTKEMLGQQNFDPHEIVQNLERLKAWFGLNCCACNPPAARLQAARIIMEYGYGTPAHSTQVPLAEGEEKDQRVQAVIDLVAPPQFEPPVRGQLGDGGVQ